MVDGGAQLSIFKAVHAAYASAGSRPVSNDELYDKVSQSAGYAPDEFRRRIPIGTRRVERSPLTRTARWAQQTMRAKNWLERVPGQRGVWRLTETGKKQLHTAPPKKVIVGFSTRLGVALVGDCRDAFADLNEPIHLSLCSPPYALAKPRGYGNVRPEEYVDFICQCMEPIVKWLAPGGSIVLNIGQDTFEPNSSARSILLERVVIAMHDRMGLKLMDRIPWHNPTKPPGPVLYASIQRVHLNVAWEPILWFCNDPSRVMSDNRRVLEPHSERHQKLIAAGGERRDASYSDGSYRIHPGRFGNPTPGKIPRNLLTIPHACQSQRRYKARARELGLPQHGAPFPLALALKLIQFLTEEGHLVVDNMAGSLTTPLACEMLERRWYCSELHAEYVRGGAERFDGDVWINPALDALLPARPDLFNTRQ